MIKSNQKFLNTFLLVVDVLIISISLFMAWFIRFNTGIFKIDTWYLDFKTYMIVLVVIIPLYVIIYNTVGLYQSHRLRSVGNEIFAILKANVIGILIFLGILFLTKQINYSRYLLFLFFIISCILSSLERMSMRLILRSFRKSGYNLKHIIVLGAGDSAMNFSSKIQKHKYLGYNIVGFLDDDEKIGFKINGAAVIGRIESLGRFIKEYNLDEVIIAISLSHYDRLGEIIKVCEKHGVKTQIIPDYYKYIPARPYIDQLDDLPIINIRYVPLDEAFNKLIKRTMDIIIALIGIIVTSPLLTLSFIIIKLTSPGPIFFKQTRVGLNRHNFEMYKFRSMKLQTEGESDTVWTTKNDPRKTKFGEFIRKTSIDELPQLLNVLKGDMSIIGPRPERPFFVDKFKEEIPKYMIKHHVRPGITGWAQVNGFRGDTSIKGRIEHDIYYIENWTLMLDIKIIFMTFFNGFINKNAY